MWALLGIFKQCPQLATRRLGQDSLVGFHHIDLRALLSQFARDYVARKFSAGQQHAFSGNPGTQALHHRLSHVLFGNQMDFESVPLDGFFGGGTDSGDLEMGQAIESDSEFSDPLPCRFDSIDAGKNQPVVCLHVLERGVQRLKGFRIFYLDKRNFDYFRAQLAQARGQHAGLMTSAAYQDTYSGEGLRLRRGHCELNSLSGRPSAANPAASAGLSRRTEALDTRQTQLA